MPKMKAEIDLTQGPIFSTILRYTVPIIATSCLSLLFNAADLVVVGQFCGTDSVAAVGSTSSLINLIINLFIGLSTGSGIVLAQAIGAKHETDINSIVHTSFFISICAGALLTVIGVLFSKTFLFWMGSPESVIDLSAVYLRIYFAGVIPMLVYNYGASLLRAMGDTVHPMIYLSIAGGLNFGLNVFFVTVFKLDVAGVALATTLSQTVSAILVLRTFYRRTDAYRFRFRGLHPNLPILGKILRIGIPVGIRGCFFSISNVMIQSSVNALGKATMAGFAAESQLNNFTYSSMNAFAIASMNVSGQCLGAGKMKRILHTVFTCMFYIVIVSVLFSTVLLTCSKPLLSIFVPGDESAIQAGKAILFILLPCYFFCGWMDMFTYTTSGMGKTMVCSIISLIGSCVLRLLFVFFMFPIPQFHNTFWLMLTYPVSWGITAAVQALFFAYTYRKIRKQRKLTA